MRLKYKLIAEEACELIINENSLTPNYLAINGYANHAISMLEKYEFNLENPVVIFFTNAKKEINKVSELSRWDRDMEYYSYLEMVRASKELLKLLKHTRRFSIDDPDAL